MKTSENFNITRRPTREVMIGDLKVGSRHRIAVQSMCATKTQDIESTVRQINLLTEHGADLVRIAVDSKRDVEALSEIREKLPEVRLSIDLQENYELAALVAPFVQKIRYNPGHLHHHDKGTVVKEKVRFLVDVAKDYSLAIRVGINSGSLDPSRKISGENPYEIAFNSAREHVGYLYDLDFQNFVISLKSSDPNTVIKLNTDFSNEFPEVPIHLGVTEAGMLPMGEVKTRVAFENLLARGIGDLIRVSLTLPFHEKFKEIEIGRSIIDDVYAGRFRSVPSFENGGLNIISCPSCSRVENESFVDLARKVAEITKFAAHENLTIAVMGCRVNGPGETDSADLGLWCAPNHVNFKRRGELIGAFSYEEITPRLLVELRELVKKDGK